MKELSGEFHIGQVILSADFRVIGMNVYARRILGPSVHELGKSLFDYHPPKSHRKIDLVLRRSRHHNSDIPLAMVIDVMGKVLMINFSRLDMIDGIDGPLFSMSFIDVSDGTGATLNPASGIVEFCKLPVLHKNTLIFLKPTAIYYFEADGNYCKIVTQQRTYYLRITLKSLLKRFTGSSFYRIHKRYIVNTRKVGRLKKTAKGSYVIQFESRHMPELPVARRRVTELKAILLAV